MKVRIINNPMYPLPQYETAQSAGCDLRADIPEPIVLKAWSKAIIPTPIQIALPDGYEAQVRGRSGLNKKYSIICPVGTVDADYRGRIGVILYNLSNEDFTIEPGDRIAQLVIGKVEQAEWEIAVTLDETERGVRGFGHSGLK